MAGPWPIPPGFFSNRDNLLFRVQSLGSVLQFTTNAYELLSESIHLKEKQNTEKSHWEEFTEVICQKYWDKIKIRFKKKRISTNSREDWKDYPRAGNLIWPWAREKFLDNCFSRLRAEARHSRDIRHFLCPSLFHLELPVNAFFF